MKNPKPLLGIAGLLAFGLAASAQTEVTVVASSNGTIRSDGPTGSPWFHNAQVVGDFASYAISSFVLTAGDFGESEVTSIDSVSLSYTQANAGFTTDGPIGIHLTFDTTVGAGDYSGLNHDGSAAGVDDAQFSDAPVSQAVFSGTFTEVESGTEDVYVLDVSGVESQLLAAINAGEPFSAILIAPGDAGAVTYAGIENNNYPEMIKLTVSASADSGGDGESALMITGVLDATLPGGTPKVIELYALEDIADLSVYGIGSANNGGGTDGVELTLEGSASAGDFIWIASEDVEFANVFGFAPDYVSGAAAINGDDAIELFLNDVVVDVFGEIDVDGNGTPWEYLDGWAYRNDESMADGTFVLDDWTFSGPDALDDLDAAGIAAAVPFGTYSPGADDGGPGTDPFGPNLLTNAGFESGVDDWDAFNGAGASGDGDPVRSGSASLKLDGSGGGFSVPGAQQTIEAAPGEVYKLQGYMLSQAALPGDATFGTLKIVFSNGTNDLVPAESELSVGAVNTANPGMESLPFLNVDSSAGNWIYTEAVAVAPEGTTQVSFFALNINQSGAVMFADDMTASIMPVVDDGGPGTDPFGPNLLTNAGFESGVEDWDAFNGAGASGDGDPVRSDSASLKLDGSGGNFSVPGAQQTIAAAPGEVYKLQGYMLSQAALPGDDTFGTLKIVFSDGTNDLVPAESELSVGAVNTANPGMESLPFLNVDSSAGNWIYTEAVAVAPEGTTQVSFFALNINQTGAVMFADDLTASVIPVEIPPLPWEGVGVDETSVSPWFGSFTGGTDDWIQHHELGWVYVGLVEATDSMWLYSYYWDTWLWTSEELFPIVYATGSNAWLYYFIVEDVGVFVFDYTTYTWSFNP